MAWQSVNLDEVIAKLHELGFDLRKEEELDGIECFHPSSADDNKKDILVENVRQFYDFFVKQPNALKEVILNNLYGRVSNIPVIDSTYDELPFNWFFARQSCLHGASTM